jgi:putative transposase
MYAAGEKPTWMKVAKRFCAAQDKDFPWSREVTKLSPQIAIQNLGAAFSGYCRWLKNEKKGRRVEHPKFKKKGECRDSFCAASTNSTDGKVYDIKVRGRQVQLAKIGWIRMRQEVRFKGRITRATVSRKADRWFVSLIIHAEDAKSLDTKKSRMCGADVGVRTLATIYDGINFHEVVGPKPYKKIFSRLRRLSQSHSRKIKGSNNRAKAKTKLARLHARIANIRRDSLHKLTTKLAKEYQTVCVEDLNVKAMARMRSLARVVADMGLGEFRQQLTYKCEWYGSELVFADRFFPSSKTCPECKVVNADLGQGDYEWACPSCKAVIPRDRGAAKNLFDYAAGHAVSARGAKRL